MLFCRHCRLLIHVCYQALVNLLRACVGLSPDNALLLEHRLRPHPAAAVLVPAEGGGADCAGGECLDKVGESEGKRAKLI